MLKKIACNYQTDCIIKTLKTTVMIHSSYEKCVTLFLKNINKKETLGKVVLTSHDS